MHVFQDKFDHDKGQKSAISGRRLHWRLSTGFFAFSPVEKIASNPVTSVAVMVFSALSFGPKKGVLADLTCIMSNGFWCPTGAEYSMMREQFGLCLEVPNT